MYRSVTGKQASLDKGGEAEVGEMLPHILNTCTDGDIRNGGDETRPFFLVLLSKMEALKGDIVVLAVSPPDDTVASGLCFHEGPSAALHIGE